MGTQAVVSRPHSTRLLYELLTTPLVPIELQTHIVYYIALIHLLLLQDLYEITFVFGSLEHFWLYSIHPRQCIPHNCFVSDLPNPGLLVIEECEKCT